ncbi:MAG: polysaccharide biosynthesis tyrosine autokinase [Gaiellaceae bacterium]
MQDESITTILWRGKALIAISVAVSVALAVLVTSLETKVYQAKALIQVVSVSAPGKNVDPVTEQEAAQGLATTYATLISSPGFLERIRGRVEGGRLSVSDLNSRISADAITTNSTNATATNLIQLTATAHSPRAARVLANDVARGFIDKVKSDAKARTANQLAEIQNQITSLSHQIFLLTRAPQNEATIEKLAALRSARAALSAQYAALVSQGAQQAGSVGLPSPPYASSSPISPRKLLNLIGAVLVGLLIGCGLAWLRARLDTGLHSPEEAEKLLNVPVLASVPLRKRFSSTDPIVSEAYDVLRANLAFVSVDHNLRVVTFTSFNPREGKTATVEGLAHAAVRGGMDVLVIDADVRTGMLSTNLGYGNSVGLSDLIVGDINSSEAIVEVAPGLSLLPAGRTPPNPPSLLASGRMADLMDWLRERHALVIIDSPPAANLADPAILAGLSDGVVIVGRVGLTKRTDLVAAAANLRHTPTPILGAVILEPRAVGEAYYAARPETEKSGDPRRERARSSRLTEAPAKVADLGRRSAGGRSARRP